MLDLDVILINIHSVYSFLLYAFSILLFEGHERFDEVGTHSLLAAVWLAKAKPISASSYSQLQDTLEPVANFSAIRLSGNKYSIDHVLSYKLLLLTGYYQDAAGNDSCIVCPQGYKCPNTSSAPELCGTGLYR